MLDRSEISRALAKAIAYKQCGKDQLAEAWACKLIDLLECASLIDPGYRAFAAKRGIDGAHLN